MNCVHENFHAEVIVDRVTRKDGELAYHATVKIRCAECRVRFAFPGLGAGLVWDRPTTDPTRLELRAPLLPDGHMTSMMAGLPGFTIGEKS